MIGALTHFLEKNKSLVFGFRSLDLIRKPKTEDQRPKAKIL